MTRKPHNARWVIVSVNKPVMLRRSDDETWLLNPRRRYVLNADIMDELNAYTETMSDLESSAHYRPLRDTAKVRLPGASVLIDRYRDRGIGDLLFTTGPLAFLHHITGGAFQANFYTYAERGAILNQCPYLCDNSPLVGPVLYDDLPLYNHHWFIDAVTEYDEEPEQLNVYDALYCGLGVDPANVDVRFKRPRAQLAAPEVKSLDDFFYWIFLNTKPALDLRNTGYYVVAPLANSSIRCAPYATWLRAIESLSQRRPVLVLGAIRDRMPTMDMSVGDFVANLDGAPDLVPAGRVINLMGKTQLRNVMQIISKANCVASLDSAALYIAEAFRTPCVSLWGSHDPRVRIGYDPEYLELAIWEKRACRYSPCFAWQGFPVNRCPTGESQTICQCQTLIEPKEIVRRFEMVEARTPKLIKIPTAV